MGVFLSRTLYTSCAHVGLYEYGTYLGYRLITKVDTPCTSRIYEGEGVPSVAMQHRAVCMTVVCYGKLPYPFPDPQKSGIPAF